MHVQDLPVCRLWCETAPVLRQGDRFLEDRGWLDGATMPLLTQPRHVEVLVPWKATMRASQAAVHLAGRPDAGQPHPSRAHQHLACVKGVEHRWEACRVPLNACGMRSGNRQKDRLDPRVLVTTDQRLTGPWSVRHSEERPDIEPDEEHRKSGGWQRKKLRATRDSAIVFSMATGVLR